MGGSAGASPSWKDVWDRSGNHPEGALRTVRSMTVGGLQSRRGPAPVRQEPLCPSVPVAVPTDDLTKSNGIHETPAPLADFLAAAVLERLTTTSGPLTVLDPACGRGALLRAIASAATPVTRGQMVLAGFETAPGALETARAELSRLDIARLALTLGDFLNHDLSDPLTGYDAVVTNPPFVRTQVLGAMRSQALARRFGLSGRVDLYQVFIRALADTLRPGGVLGLIASNRFLSIRAGAVVRRLLRERFELLDVLDLGDTRLFPAAAVLPAVVIARKRADGPIVEDGSPPEPPVRFARVYGSRDDRKVVRSALDGPETTTGLFEALNGGVEGPVRIGGRALVIERGTLASSDDPNAPWALVTPAHRDWLARVEACRAGSIGDVGRVRVGIKTTADHVFLRDDWEDLPIEFRPEPELLRPLRTHRDAARWTAREKSESTAGERAMRVLYPHRIGPDGSRAAIDLAVYPRAAAYLEMHRDRLEGRRYVRDAGRHWYEIWVPQGPAGWASPKIVFPDIAEHPRAFLDETGAVVNGDCYWIAPHPNTADNTNTPSPRLLLALAVLNSSLATAYYDALYHNKLYAGRRRFITQYVATFPLPDLAHPSAAEAAAIAGRLAAGGLSPNEANRLDTACDRLVRDAFGLLG